MVGPRLATAAVGVVASLLLSALLWWYTGSIVFFLVVPFVLFLFRSTRDRAPVRTCPFCGFRTADQDFEYCPRDGRRLE